MLLLAKYVPHAQPMVSLPTEMNVLLLVLLDHIHLLIRMEVLLAELAQVNLV